MKNQNSKFAKVINANQLASRPTRPMFEPLENRRLLSGHTIYEAVTLDRGVTADATFAAWAASTSTGSSSQGSSTPSGEAIMMTRGVTTDSSFASWAAGA